MTYTFKIGDKVKFKGWKTLSRDYGIQCRDIVTPYTFNRSMNWLCGLHAEVIKVTKESDICTWYEQYKKRNITVQIQNIEVKLLDDYTQKLYSIENFSFDNFMFEPMVKDPCFMTL